MHKKLKTLNHQYGFTLIELMIVVAIISILATLAIPRFQKFQVTAKQTEAKVNLGHIYDLVLLNYLESGRYNNLSNPVGSPNVDLGVGITDQACSEKILGFSLANCEKARYVYVYPDASVVGPTQTLIVARSPIGLIAPGCTSLSEDVWAVADPPHDFLGVEYGNTPTPYEESGKIHDASKFCN